MKIVLKYLLLIMVSVGGVCLYAQEKTKLNMMILFTPQYQDRHDGNHMSKILEYVTYLNTELDRSSSNIIEPVIITRTKFDLDETNRDGFEINDYFVNNFNNIADYSYEDGVLPSSSQVNINLMVLMTAGESSVVCGAAGGTNINDIDHMFASVFEKDSCGSHTFAHEVGHLLGLTHNDGMERFNVDGIKWQSIMHAPDSKINRRYFTNPNIEDDIFCFGSCGDTSHNSVSKINNNQYALKNRYRVINIDNTNFINADFELLLTQDLKYIIFASKASGSSEIECYYWGIGINYNKKLQVNEGCYPNIAVDYAKYQNNNDGGYAYHSVTDSNGNTASISTTWVGDEVIPVCSSQPACFNFKIFDVTPETPNEIITDITLNELGCFGLNYGYRVLWSANQDVGEFDVDIKYGNGSWNSFYNGSLLNRPLSVSSGTSFSLRARARNANGWSNYKEITNKAPTCRRAWR